MCALRLFYIYIYITAATGLFAIHLITSVKMKANNETSVKNTDHLKIFHYNVFKTNKRNEQFAGAAIAIKKNITAQIEDDYYQDFISATIQTEHGPITVATGYIPPRLAFINSIDLNKIFNRRHPAYLVGDLNAYHRTFGYSNNNLRGKQVVTLINANKCKHIGPFFDTRITANTTRKPDIALTNKQAHLNTYLKAGPLTPSDHLPIIMKISTNPIQIPITPRLQFSKTNWTLYKQTLSNFETPNLAQETLENIDLHIETWTNKIKQITHATTPTIHYRVLSGVKQNNYIRKTQRMHKKLMSIINMHGTNIQRHQLLQTLRQNISDEYNRLNNITWDNIIAKIDTNNDPKTFFKAIKRMTGNASNISPYIIHNEIKLYDPRQQEAIFRDYWKNIFTSEDPNDNDFDYEFTENIENQLNERTERITPHNNSDINRLNINNCPTNFSH